MPLISNSLMIKRTNRSAAAQVSQGGVAGEEHESFSRSAGVKVKAVLKRRDILLTFP